MMGKINWGRVALGGLLWAVVYLVLGGASWFLFFKPGTTEAFANLGRPFPETLNWVAFLGPVALVTGIFTIWLYAAIRPRYGPGPKTAAIAGFAVWVVALLPSVAWVWVLELPGGLFALQLAAALVVFVVAAEAGAWLYKEE